MNNDKYDYLDADKKGLTLDGKQSVIFTLGSFENSEVLISLGDNGKLKGKALEDYLAFKNRRQMQTDMILEIEASIPDFRDIATLDLGIKRYHEMD